MDVTRKKKHKEALKSLDLFSFEASSFNVKMLKTNSPFSKPP
jgi:hypothetical protein